MSIEIYDEVIEGSIVTKTIVSEDFTLRGYYQGSVEILSGKFVLAGTLQGSLLIKSDQAAEIIGSLQGSIHVSKYGNVLVSGRLQGSTHIESGATVVVEHGAIMAGSLHNNGALILRGVFGGSRSGSGEFIVEEGGYIKEPVIKDGTYYYEF